MRKRRRSECRSCRKGRGAAAPQSDLRGHARETAAPCVVAPDSPRSSSITVTCSRHPSLGARPARSYWRRLDSRWCDLGSAGLPHVHEGAAPQVSGLDLVVSHRSCCVSGSGRAACTIRLSTTSSTAMRHSSSRVFHRVGAGRGVFRKPRAAGRAPRSVAPVGPASVQVIGTSRRLASGNTNRILAAALPVHPPQDRQTSALEGVCVTDDGDEVGTAFGMGTARRALRGFWERRAANAAGRSSHQSDLRPNAVP